nr:response regulator [Pelagicoccus albus]
MAEDNTFIRELVATYLEKLGYEVSQAPNGADAIDILNQSSDQHFDVIVTDLLMPKASGDRVIKEARRSGACDRFLVMSGNLYDPKFTSEDPDPDSEFIEKPFTFTDFEAKLSDLGCKQKAELS